MEKRYRNKIIIIIIITARAFKGHLHNNEGGLITIPARCYRVFQGQISSGSFTWYHTVIEATDQTCYPSQSQYTGNGPTIPITNSVTLCAWQGGHKRLLFVGCVTSQQQAGVSQGRICSDNFTCCHTEIEVADQTVYLTQSQYTDTGPTSPSADPITPGAWQGSHWSANFEVTGMTRPGKKSRRKRDSNPGPSALEADALPLSQRGGPAQKAPNFDSLV